VTRRFPPVRAAGADPGTGIREAILDAALVTFTEHTYGGTSMALVAERAGVAIGSIYRHFPSKETLGNAVYLHWKTELLERLRDNVDGAAPFRDGFGQVWRALAGFVAERPDAFAFLEYQQHEGYLEADSRAVSDEVSALVLDLLRRGQRAGDVRPAAAEVLLALAYGAFVGLSKAMRAAPPRARGGRAASAAKELADAETAVWDLLRAH
jgi:AcrR family transcriptional regulator